MNEIVTNEERRRTLIPATRVFEQEGQVLVTIELPGVSQSNLEIRVEGREVTVVGKREPIESSGTWLLRERPWGDFQKSLTVGDTIDLEKIDAQLIQGILTLTLPTKEAAKPKRIEIRSA